MTKGTFSVTPEDGQTIEGVYTTDITEIPPIDPDPPEPPQPGDYEAKKGLLCDEGKLTGCNLANLANNGRKISVRAFVDLKELTHPVPPDPQPPAPGEFFIGQQFLSNLQNKPANSWFEAEWNMYRVNIWYYAEEYRNHPDKGSSGWGGSGSRPPYESDTMPLRKDIESCAERAGTEYSMLDIEKVFKGWTNNSADHDKVSMSEDFGEILRWYKGKLKPGQKAGWYRMAPYRDYGAHQPNGNLAKLQHNDDLCNEPGGMFDELDYNSASLYTFYDDWQGWKRYAEGSFVECKRVQPNKICLAHLWMQYHPTNDALKHQYIDGDFFRFQLDTCLNHPDCDGIIIWGPTSDSKITWSQAQNMGWWQELDDFCRTLKASSRTTTRRPMAVDPEPRDEVLLHSGPGSAFSLKFSRDRSYIRFALDPGIMYADSVDLAPYQTELKDYWIEVMVSVDLDSLTCQMYVSQHEALAEAVWTDATKLIQWSAAANVTLGGLATKDTVDEARHTDGAIQEVYIVDEFIDWPQNFEKFTIDGYPVYLGDKGELPTGNAALVYMNGEINVEDALYKNLGAGPDFTVWGDVPPSDSTPHYPPSGDEEP